MSDGNGNYFHLDSLNTCGIVRIHHDGENSYGFNCLVPNTVKEEDVPNYICGLLDSLKDEIRERNSWRFRDHKKPVEKPSSKQSSKPISKKQRVPSGRRLGPLIDEALKKKNKKR